MLPLLFANSLNTFIFWVAFAVWAIPEWIGAATQRVKRNARIQDRGSYAVLMLGIWMGLGLNFWLPSLLPGATITWHRSLLFFIGVALMLSGVALRWYAIHALGRYFTREVAIHPDQPIVQSGPYRYIRHPSYSGTLMTMLGIGLAMANWASLIAIMACTLLGHSYRVAIEEHALCEKLGQRYVEYMRRTRRFIPFVY
jgi:protein-S-isoprenylcysteine O-methyltransferase